MLGGSLDHPEEIREHGYKDFGESILTTLPIECSPTTNVICSAETLGWLITSCNGCFAFLPNV